MIDGLPFMVDAGIGIGVVTPGEPVVRANPTTQVVPSCPNTAIGYDFDERSGLLDRPIHWHSARKYERMYSTPAIGSSFNALRASTLSGGVGLLPAIKPASELGKPGQVAGSGVEADMAVHLAESNRRTLDAWDTPVDLVLWEMVEAMFLGHVMAEIVADDVSGGPDDGQLAVKALRPLHRTTYRFLMDRLGNVGQIKALALDEGQKGFTWQNFEPDHFAWLTWDSHRGDPRGRSCFRMAVESYDMLVDLWPDIMDGWKQFGTPCTVGILGPNDNTPVPMRDANGNEISGKTITPIERLAVAGVKLRNGKFVALSNGSEIKVVESSKDATVVSGAIRILQEEMVKSILIAPRMTVESKNGSRADSETAQDVAGTLIRFVRKWLERFVRSILIRQNTWNYGDAIARRLTPLVDLGGTEHQDFAANATGIATLYQSAYFTANQLAYTDTFLGLPQRQPGDVRVGPNGIVPDSPAPDPIAPADPAPPPDAPDVSNTDPTASAGPKPGGAA